MAASALILAGCGEPASPGAVATNPGIQGTAASSSTPSASASTGTRTVLSPLGLNIHAAPQLSAAVLGTAAQGVNLTVVGNDAQGGGWYRVQGQTLTGWIVADPSLTAPGLFAAYQSSERMFNALYPQDWTFADEATDVLFHPLQGAQTIVVRTAARPADLGAIGATGYIAATDTTVVVCGITGELRQFRHAGAAPATPAPGTAGPLPLLAQVRLTLDGSHALGMDYNYVGPGELQHFTDFLNSMTFPFPQCQAPVAPSPSPT